MPTVVALGEPEGPARATWMVTSVSRSRAEATPNKSTLLFDIKGPYRIYHSFFDVMERFFPRCAVAPIRDANRRLPPIWQNQREYISGPIRGSR